MRPPPPNSSTQALCTRLSAAASLRHERPLRYRQQRAYALPIVRIAPDLSSSVTVIVAARNAQNWIRDCVRSILVQSLPFGIQLQLIVGVDGCADTLGVLQSLESRSLTVMYFARPCGPYRVFNACAQYATGELLFRFDADDVMLPGYLSAQLALFRSRPDVRISRTWSIHTNANLVPYESILSDGCLTPPNGKLRRGSDGQFAIRRVVWSQLGGVQPWQCLTDSEFLARARLSGFRVEEVNDYLYLRRIHPRSLTKAIDTGYGSSVRNAYQIQINSMVRLNRSNNLGPAMLCTEIDDHDLVRWPQ